MWCCQYSTKRPVEISIVIRNNSDDRDFGISKFKLWNYNKNLTVSVVYKLSSSLSFQAVISNPFYQLYYCMHLFLGFKCWC